MNNRITNLIKVANFLGDAGNKVLLEKWLHMSENNNWTLPFIGRFSAGKSTLLNALLEKPILPTARVETTAVLTEIKYASIPSAETLYTDGSAISIPVEDIANLSHKNLERNSKEVSAIEIRYPAQVLKNGLIFMDSPGMDTIINKHVALAEHIMLESIMVVYVMASAPSEFDLGILKRLQESGVEIVVVRTHLDDIKEEEESFINVVDNDENILSKLESPVRYFPVSSLDSAPMAAKAEFARFKSFLQNEVVANLREVYVKRLSLRLDKISEYYKKTLNDRKDLILAQANKSEAEIERKISEVKNVMSSLEASIDIVQKNIETQKGKVKNELEDEIADLTKVAKSNFKRSVKNIYTSNGSEATESTKKFFQQSMAKLTQEISDSVTSILSRWAASESQEIQDDFSKVSDLLKDYDIHFDPEFNLDRVNDLTLQQEALVDRINNLSMFAKELESLTEEQLNQLEIEKDDLQATIDQLNGAHAEAVEVIGNLNENYQPRYIHKPSKMGAVMKKIGLAGDIAMLLIPAVGWEKGAAMLAGKATSLAAKGNNVAKLGSHVLNGAANVTKIMAKTDTAKDMATLVGMGTKTLSSKKLEASKKALVRVADNLIPLVDSSNASPQLEIENKKTSFFDYLSLSYWFGKFGEMIDPPTTEIDAEYERRYNEAKNACEQRAYMTARERLDQERKLGRVKNEIEAKEKEKKWRIEALERQRGQYEKQLQKISKTKEEAIQQAFADAWNNEYSKEVETVTKRIRRNLDELLTTIAQQILSAASYAGFSQLEEVRETLEKTIQKKESSREEALMPIKEIDGLLHSLS